MNVTIVTRWFISQWHDPWPAKIEFPSAMERHTIGAIGPGVEHRQWGAADMPLDQESAEAVFKYGTGRLTICGFVEYSDKLTPPGQHVTKFCLYRPGPQAEFCVSGPHNDCT